MFRYAAAVAKPAMPPPTMMVPSSCSDAFDRLSVLVPLLLNKAEVELMALLRCCDILTVEETVKTARWDIMKDEALPRVAAAGLRPSSSV
jgi:hypothetical protein